jgi:hypothetical protein
MSRGRPDSIGSVSALGHLLAGRDGEAFELAAAASRALPGFVFVAVLAAFCPAAKIVLTRRSSESWSASFSETIAALLARADEAPAQARPWFDMCRAVIQKNGFRAGMSRAELQAAFEAHAEAVRAGIPAGRLLIYEVRSGWGPLCAFLGQPVPAQPFPVTNNRQEFWELAKQVIGRAD